MTDNRQKRLNYVRLVSKFGGPRPIFSLCVGVIQSWLMDTDMNTTAIFI